MALPVIAIIGRPNVGKSTLFNRLAGRRIAIVSEIPGTTRDRVSTDAEWGRHRYLLVDTAGVEDRPHDALLWDDIKKQVEVALNQADGIIFTVDVNEGVTDADADADVVAYPGRVAMGDRRLGRGDRGVVIRAVGLRHRQRAR